MTTTDSSWAFPAQLRPKQEGLHFDLETALQSIVLVRSEVPERAFTAGVLGTERLGHGIVIRDDGLVLTIGYLITEAESIWLTTHDGAAVAGHALAYDHVTGFGLVLPLGRLDAPAMQRGESESAAVGDAVTVMGHGGVAHALEARVTAIREFAGYWEYLLERALFTTPVHPQWAGTALVGQNGRLLGVGSLLIQDTSGPRGHDANMFVPIELLEPILDEMLRLGRPARTPRPWLGMYTTQLQGVLVVGGLAQGGPAQRAGVQPGDVLIEVAGTRVDDLAGMLRQVWSLGPAGIEIPMTVLRAGASAAVSIKSADRTDFLAKPRRH